MNKGLQYVWTSKTTIGTINVTTLRDGERTLPLEALKNLSNEDTDEINSNENQLLTFTNFNACVIQNGKQNLLVDTGCGESIWSNVWVFIGCS